MIHNGLTMFLLITLQLENILYYIKVTSLFSPVLWFSGLEVHNFFNKIDAFLWNNFGTILGLFWDNFRTIFGQFLDHFVKISGQIRDHL